MTPAELVAQRTWILLGRAKALRAPFGEESLTDLLVLEMLGHQRARGFSLQPTTKQQEASCGADLLVAVRHGTGRWSRFVLQAKKLFPDGRYRALNRRQESLDQLKRLEQCARQLRALPLCLLYNHTTSAQPSQYRLCPLSFPAEQLGCTLVPSWHISHMIHSRSPRTFDQAHCVSQSMLWRCAFDCPFAHTCLMKLAFRPSDADPTRPKDADRTIRPAYDWPVEPLPTAWPERLFRESISELTYQDFDEIRMELSDIDGVGTLDTPQRSVGLLEGPLYPARILLVDQMEDSPVRFQKPQAP